jgi:hypothetical protein
MGMLGFVRRTRAVSLFALLVMLGSVPVAVTALVHDDGDDPDCQPSLVLHDHSAHRIGTARTTPVPQGQHCVVCHWLQSLQTTTPLATVGAPPSDCHQLAVVIHPLTLASVKSSLAARAPPRSLPLA